MRHLRLLFETQTAAREVAFMLRCRYDGCNMVTLPLLYDIAALRTAIDLVRSDFCFDGDYYPLGLPLSSHELNQLTDENLAERIFRKSEVWYSQTVF